MTQEDELREDESALERWGGEGGAPADQFGAQQIEWEQQRLHSSPGVAVGARIEHDGLGDVTVPASALYGASTQRARQNFPISDLRLPRSFLRALGLIKMCAARVNRDLGLLDPHLANAIEQAAAEVSAGSWDSHFVVDLFQTGSGTSTNMNANEVIANRAGELLGGKRGGREVHPNDHVNLGQSSNDLFPSATHLAALGEIEALLMPALRGLLTALQLKSRQFWPVIKTGRTHLQDATPIRLGQEFLGYAGQVRGALRQMDRVRTPLSTLALGGTAVGTGVNTHPDFAPRVIAELARTTSLTLEESSNHFEAQATLDAVVETSGVLRGVAVSLGKIADDIRWLGSGPRAGLGELKLPATQPGSSIMPGKVNPVIPESFLQVVAQVVGNDATVAWAGAGGHFELNLMMPVAAYNLLQSIAILAAATANLNRRCVLGLEATGRGPELVEAGPMLATALVPHMGYDAAALIAEEAQRSGRTVYEVACERSELSEDELKRILDPSRMV